MNSLNLIRPSRMPTQRENERTPAAWPRWLLIAALASGFAVPAANAGDAYHDQSIAGDYVVQLHGSFKAVPPPPLPDEVLRLDATLIGRYVFDGLGQLTGEHITTFSHAAVPFNPRSMRVANGEYAVEPNGRLLIQVDEHSVDPATGVVGPPDGTFTIECYIVQRQRLARCVMHSLVSFQLGPSPVLLPTTMAGSIERQN